MKKPQDLTREELETLVESIQRFTFLDLYEQVWDLDKDLGSDYIADVVACLARFGLAPDA